MGISPTYVPVIRNGVNVSFGNVAATGTLTVAGASTLSGGLTVTGGTSLDNATVSGTLGVTGVATFTASPVFNGGISVPGTSSLAIVHASAVDVTQLTVNGAGTLTVGTGATTLGGALSVTGFTGLAAAQTSGNLTVFGSSLILGSAGTGLQIKEGANATSGVATLVAGTVTVNTNKVTATSRIQLTGQVDGGTPGFQRVSARVAGTSFTITSSNAADTSQVAWTLIEPAP